MSDESSGGDTSNSGVERTEDHECWDCGAGIDTHQDDHFVLTEESRPIPDRDDMEFDDWFRTNWVFCTDCAPDVDCDISTDTECGDSA